MYNINKKRTKGIRGRGNTLIYRYNIHKYTCISKEIYRKHLKKTCKNFIRGRKQQEHTKFHQYSCPPTTRYDRQDEVWIYFTIILVTTNVSIQDLTLGIANYEDCYN